MSEGEKEESRDGVGGVPAEDSVAGLIAAAQRIVDEHRHEPDCLGGYPEYGLDDCTCGLYDLERAIWAVEDARRPATEFTGDSATLDR